MITLRPAWPTSRGDDWIVLDDGKAVGRMYEDHGSPTPWFWCLSGAAENASQLGIANTGRAATLEGAKAAFRWSYEQWIKRRAAASKPA